LLGVANGAFSKFDGKSSGSNCWTLQSDGDAYMDGSGSGNVFKFSEGDKLGLLINLEEG
jgi:hypothetical protein